MGVEFRENLEAFQGTVLLNHGSLMQAVMNRSVGAWLEDNIDELNQAYGEHRSPVVLILSYALLSRAGLATKDFQSIIEEKGSSKMKYEAGSVAEELVAEGKAETKTQVARRLINMGLSDEEISKATDLHLNAVADLRSDL